MTPVNGTTSDCGASVNATKSYQTAFSTANGQLASRVAYQGERHSNEQNQAYDPVGSAYDAVILGPFLIVWKTFLLSMCQLLQNQP